MMNKTLLIMVLGLMMLNLVSAESISFDNSKEIDKLETINSMVRLDEFKNLINTEISDETLKKLTINDLEKCYDTKLLIKEKYCLDWEKLLKKIEFIEQTTESVKGSLAGSELKRATIIVSKQRLIKVGT